MNRFQVYAVQHPQAIMLFFAFVAGYAGWTAFRAGMALQFLRSDGIQSASEALGG